MGLNWHGVKFLAQARRQGADFTRTITIGRLNQNVSNPKVRQILERNGIAHTLTDQDVLAGQAYAEPIFRQLGAKVVDSMDATNYEQATVVADLNHPIPDELHGKYDLVYDGGTIEHVFNVPQALKNIMSLAKVGGNVVIQTMANNWFGHGFYQFSPELFYRVFSPDNGFRVVKCVIHGSYELAQWYDVPDPKEVRGRIELANSWHGVMLAIHARREAIVPIFEKTPQQSDYAAAWKASGGEAGVAIASNADSAGAVAPPQPGYHAPHPTQPGLKKRVIGSLKQKLPWALRLKHKLMLALPGIPRMLNGRGHRHDRQRFSASAQPHKFRRVD
ncbi:MAG TPA: hypothetical protein VFC78_20595 [Tepidisphaeraceae bacterium]|nr:hypothetical protein [Tepidisphaeraceae bacterium]